MKEDIKIIQEHINLLQHRIAIVKENPKGKKAYIEKMNREKRAFENLIKGYKELEEKVKIIDHMCLVNKEEYQLIKNNDYIPKSKVREKIEILEKCTTNIDRKVNLTDYIIIGETERAVGRFVNLDFIKKVLLEEPGYDIELLQEGDK